MMTDFIIYSKNGVVKHESKTAYNNDGEEVQTDSLEYHGSWMGECYLSVSVHSAYPIDFQIGDYLDYRGERFTLATDPAVVKKSSRGSYGEGFDYSDIKFNSRGTELTDIRFLDVVLGDNEIHYTSLPDFPFYYASIEDYADAMQANTNRWCSENGFALTDYWLFVTPDEDRFIQRAGLLKKVNGVWTGLTRAQAEAIYLDAYRNGFNVTDEKKDINGTISGEGVNESLVRIKNDFGLNFITRDRKLIIGSAGIPVAHLFQYGVGNGLYEMERQVDNDQQVITKLYAYGSEKNMPVRYYANVQKNYYDYIRGYKLTTQSGNVSRCEMEMDENFVSSYFTHQYADSSTDPDGEQITETYLVDIKVNDITVPALAYKRESSNHIFISVYGAGYYISEVFLTTAQFNSFVAALNRGDRMYFTKHINKKKWPEKKYVYSNVGITAYTQVLLSLDATLRYNEYVNLEFIVDTPFNKDYFILKSTDIDKFNEVGEPVDAFIVSMSLDDYKVTGLVWEETSGDYAGKCRVRVRYDSHANGSAPKDYEELSYQKALAFCNNRQLYQDYDLIINSGADEKTFPTVTTDYTEPDLPNNMNVAKLMLPGFPTQSLYDWVKANGGTDCNDATGQATWHGYTAIFSKERYRPFIMSLNSAELGVKESSKNFDGSDETDEIFPTLEGTGYDVIRHADVVTDNGMFDEGAEKPTIKLTVPDFDDLDQLVEEGSADGGTPTISMKDGYCGGRNFVIRTNTLKRVNNYWVVECEREYDSSMEIYFPNSDNVAHGERAEADEAFQIRGNDIEGYDGDHFVYVGIPLSKTYVDAASLKLLEKALEFLSKNDYTRYTYLPKVNELYMATQHDEAKANGGVSIYETIKEGDLIDFKEDDLQIAESLIFIDSLTIKENGNNGIPTYELTLRSEKTVGTLQRIQNQINSLTSGGTSVQPSGAGVLTEAAVRDIVNDEAKDKYLRKDKEDTARGLVGFMKGLWVGIRDKWGISEEGDATLNAINASDVNAPNIKTNNIQSDDYTGDGMADTGFRLFSSGGHSKLTVDEIYVRMKMVAEKLEVKERTYTGGDQIWSCAGNQVVRVDYLGNNETADHVPVMVPVHADGSPSSAGAADTYMVPEAGDTYGYSYIEVPWLARGLALLAGNKALAKSRKVRFVMEEPVAVRGARSAASPISHVRRARCYFLAKDGDREIKNWWRINDLARCQTMNLANTTRQTYISGEDTKQGNIFWWRKVIGVSYEPVTLDDGKQYHYFDVAFDYDLESSSPETMVTSVMEGSDIPAAGDAVVQFGNTIIEGRMNLMMMEVNGSDAVGYNPSTDAPCLKAYRGVYSFDLTKSWIGGRCCKMMLSPKSGYEFYGPHFLIQTEYDLVRVPIDRALWTDICRKKNAQGQYIDQWQFEQDDYGRTVEYSDDETTGRVSGVRKCYYYDKVSHNGNYWLCSIVDGEHWVDGNGNYISDADYAALSDEAKSQCARKQNYTIEEPSESSTDWTLLVASGGSSVRIDIDNQQDIVSLDGEGKVRFDRIVVVHAKILEGGSTVTSDVTKADTLTPANLRFGNATTGCTPTISNVVDGVVTITWAFTKGMEITVGDKTISLVYGNETHSAVFSLGSTNSEVIYQVLPSPSEVSFSVNSTTNQLTPSSISLVCDLTKDTGSGTIETIRNVSNYQISTGNYLYYRIKSNGSWGNWTAYTGALTVASSSSSTDYEFAISTQPSTATQQQIEAGIYEREVVPVVKDGYHGDGVDGIERFYQISAYDAPDAPSQQSYPTDISSWSANSPAVTEAKPYLWEKIVTDYRYKTDTVEYNCVGVRGDRGIDAQDIEWVYIRTKTNIAPVIDSDNNYTDSNNKTYTSDDHLPKVVAGTGGSLNDIEGNNSGDPSKLYECTDDPKGVNDTWKFEWEIKRTKGAAVNGHRTWNYYSGDMTLHNNLAESAYIIDTDNDNDQFGTDSDSYVLEPQTRRTNVTVFDGATPQTLSSLSVELKYEDNTPVPTTGANAVATYTANASTGAVAVTILQNNNTPFTHDEIQAIITASVTGKGNKSTVFTIRKVKSGQPGVSPTIYQLNPTNKNFVFNRDTDGTTLTPNSRSTVVNALKTIGNSTSDATSSDNLTFTWGYDEVSTSQGSGSIGDSSSNTIVVSSSAASSHYQVWIQLSSGDRETLPIVKDGTKGDTGASPFIADFDNEMDSVACDISGNAVALTRLYTEVSSYYGSTPKTAESTIRLVSNDTGGTVRLVDSGSSTATGIDITSATSMASGMNFVRVQFASGAAVAQRGTVVLEIAHATYGTRQLTFTINGVRPGSDGEPATIFRLVPSTNQIAKKHDGSFVPAGNTMITCAVKKTVGENTTDALPSEYVLKYSKDGGPETPYPTNPDGIQVSTVNSSLVFLVYDTNVTTVLLDRETIPVVEDGVGQPSYTRTQEAWSNDESTATINTAPVTAHGRTDGTPSHVAEQDWSDTTPANPNDYTYLWRRSRRMVLQSDGTYAADGQWSYARLSGTNGTSIKTKGSVAVVILSSDSWPTTGFSTGDLGIKQGDDTLYTATVSGGVASWSKTGNTPSDDGDSYTIQKDCTIDINGGSNPVNIKGHLLMWSDEANKWLDLGQFKGDTGTTYYTHVAWASGVTIGTPPSHTPSPGQINVPNASAVNTFSITPFDGATHMGLLIDTVAGQDSTSKFCYTWQLVQGPKGADAFSVGLSNEHEDFLYDEAGTLVAPLNGATSQASLREGSTDRTGLATWAVCCEVDQQGNDLWVMADNYTSNNAKAKAKITNGGLLTVEELRQDSVVIKVRAFYGYKTYVKEFTANKVYQDKYDIEVKPSSIAFNDSEAWQDKRITVTASGVDLHGNPLTVTISSDTTPQAGRFYVFYGYVSSDGSVGYLTNTEGSYVTLNRTMARSKMGVYFELRKYITANTYRLCDYETVEIAKTENGPDGLTFSTSPFPIYIDQNVNDPTDFGLPKAITFFANRGTTALSNVLVTQISSMVGVTAEVTNPTTNTCQITAIVPTTVGQQTIYPDSFSFNATISFTDLDGSTQTKVVPVSGHINYMGTFRTKIIGDTEESIAQSMGFVDPGTGEIQWQNVASYIRSSSAAISTLERIEAAKNHMPSSGYTNLSGVISTTNFDEDEQSFSGNVYTPCLVLLGGDGGTAKTYCLSVFSSGSGLACARRVLAYAGNTKPAKPSSIITETSINMSAVSPAETWDGMTRYKGTFTLSAKSYVFIKLTPQSGGTLSHVQLEEVSQSSDNPTPWEIGAKYYSSQIKQTADTIIARANQAGLVIDGVNNHIDLIAGKVNFLTAGGATNPKIAIDPTTGTLYAVDGVFEGTVKASNLYLNVALTAGVSETVLIGANGATEKWIGFYYNVTISSTTFQAGEYYRVSDIDPSIFEILELDFDDCWSYCTGYASEVNFVNTDYTLQSAPSVRLPRAQDVDGKVITIRNCRNDYATDYAGDVYIEQIDYPGGYSGNNPFQESMYLAGGTIHYGSNAQTRYSLNHNWIVQLRSVGTYWVVISKFRTVD